MRYVRLTNQSEQQLSKKSAISQINSSSKFKLRCYGESMCEIEKKIRVRKLNK